MREVEKLNEQEDKGGMKALHKQSSFSLAVSVCVCVCVSVCDVIRLCCQICESVLGERGGWLAPQAGRTAGSRTQTSFPKEREARKKAKTHKPL